jgi:hypothetical protein
MLPVRPRVDLCCQTTMTAGAHHSRITCRLRTDCRPTMPLSTWTRRALSSETSSRLAVAKTVSRSIRSGSSTFVRIRRRTRVRGCRPSVWPSTRLPLGRHVHCRTREAAGQSTLPSWGRREILGAAPARHTRTAAARGMPFVADESRVRAAVFGLCGVLHDGEPDAPHITRWLMKVAGDRLEPAAKALTIPVLSSCSGTTKPSRAKPR